METKLELNAQLISCMMRLDTLRILKGFTTPTKAAVKAGMYDEMLFKRTSKLTPAQLTAQIKTLAATLANDTTMQKIKAVLPNIADSPKPITDILAKTAAPSAASTGTTTPTNPMNPAPVWLGGYIQFNLNEVYCIDETDGFLGSEAGEDEIYLSGFGVDEKGATQSWKKRADNGSSQEVASFKVANFEEGSSTKRVKTYAPALNLLKFPIHDSFPLTVTNTLILIESDDEGDLAKEAKKLVDKAKAWCNDNVAKEVAKIPLLTEAMKKQIASWIDKAVADVLDWAYNLLFGNDEFKAIITQFTIPGRTVLDSVVAELQAVGDKYLKKQITSQQLVSLSAQASAKLPHAQEVKEIAGHGGKYRLKWEWNVFPGTGLG